MSHRSLIVPLLLSTIACTNPAETQTETETETGEDPATRGLPEGESTWSGTIEVNDFPLAIDATLINSGGDLEMTFRITDLGDFVLTGTHEPASGLVALAGPADARRRAVRLHRQLRPRHAHADRHVERLRERSRQRAARRPRHADADGRPRSADGRR